MIDSDSLNRARTAFADKAWGMAYAEFAAADSQSPLGPEDLEQLALAAYLTGRDEEAAAAWTRAYHTLLDTSDQTRAALCAFWLAWGLYYKGQEAQSNGWFGRAQQVVDECGHECVAKGLLLVPSAHESYEGGDLETAGTLYSQALEIGESLGSPDVIAFSRLGWGEVLIRSGEVDAGVALLDEVMVATISGELSPMLTGTMYCAVLIVCQEILDVTRAREWTAALDAWCASQPDLVPFRGQCLIHRSEVMLLGGDWSGAMDEARHARELLSRPPPQPAVAMAYYQQGELYRLRGEFAEADTAYREANHWGRVPQPGLALLRLAQGNVNAAATTIERVLGEATDIVTRSGILPAYVEIMLAAGNSEASRDAAQELHGIAEERDASLLRAAAGYAAGSVLLAEGDANEALDPLRRACSLWQELEVPYEGARARAQLGLAYQALGDQDAAELELDAARRAFRELGATPHLDRLSGPDEKAAGGLTERELQVLRLVADGKTNHAIAAELHLSDHTVRRHLQNVFDKVGVSSRAAATAYALQNDLI
jgi:DNA-binding CsgD family transcriptional regulator